MVIVVDCKSMGFIPRRFKSSLPHFLIKNEYSLKGKIVVSKIIDVGSNPTTRVITHSLKGKVLV